MKDVAQEKPSAQNIHLPFSMPDKQRNIPFVSHQVKVMELETSAPKGEITNEVQKKSDWHNTEQRSKEPDQMRLIKDQLL